MKKAITTLCLLALCSLHCALAAQPINERRPVKPDGRLQVSNAAGSIEIEGWDRDEVLVTGSLGEGAERLDISGDDRDLSLEVRVPRQNRNVEDSRLRVQVPRGVTLSVDGVSADISVRKVHGALKASTVSGDLSLSVDSEEVSAKTVSGDLDLRGPAKQANLNSVSGDISASGASGKLKLETVSGGIQLSGAAPFSELDLKSVSGDFKLDLSLLPEGRIVGETLSGEISLRLPASSSALVTLRSFSGEVSSDFAGVVAAEEKRQKRSEFKIGSGQGRIDLSSFSGDIAVEKR